MDDGSDLVRRAFEMARASGKADWRRMTVAVLKNRMLQLTNREFSEARYGAKTFLDFLRNADDIVRIDETAWPAVVEYPDAVGGVEAEQPDRFTRVRPDLWRAVMDYASRQTFVWDSAAGRAREATASEAPENARPENALPTISPDELSAWRGEFVARHVSRVDTTMAARLETWQKHRLPSVFLPSPLRGEWNKDLKSRVEARLRDWFQHKGLPPPPDLVAVPADVLREGYPCDLGALRQLVTDCVAVMTDKELSDLRLPPAAVLRAQRARRSSK